ncbi:4-hydroxyphenylpyruvate dioxygenase-like protein isoform X2 [Artemia franciscana]
MEPVVHHIEICTSNIEKITKYFIEKLNFELAYVKENQDIKQNAVKSGECILVITKRVEKLVDSNGIVINCSKRECNRDTVFNLAFAVKDIKLFCDNYVKAGGVIITPCRTINDSFGSIQIAQVKSICGNVIHTLLNKSRYKGFLPGFRTVSIGCDNSLVDYMDHVTYVCETGQMDSVIEFYEKTFGMKRFMINRLDQPIDGLIIGGSVGMKLKVMDYWKCAEAGLRTSGSRKISIVLAESLPGQANSHIRTFLDEHGGPGIQHIGLHTKSIVPCVSRLHQNGVQFRKPPEAYYSSVGKLDEIIACGEDLAKFKQLGILIDCEADASDPQTLPTNAPKDDRYLLQIFTLPVFDEDTFFLEVIQRKVLQDLVLGMLQL